MIKILKIILINLVICSCKIKRNFLDYLTEEWPKNENLKFFFKLNESVYTPELISNTIKLRL